MVMNILYIGILFFLVVIYIYAKKRAEKRKNDLLNQQRLLNIVEKVSKTKTEKYRIHDLEDYEELGDFEFPKELNFKGIYNSTSEAEIKEGNVILVGHVNYVCIKGKWVSLAHTL